MRIALVIGATERSLARIHQRLDRLETLMTKGLDDVKTEVASLKTAVTNAANEIHSLADRLLDALNNDDTDELETVASDLRALGTTLNDATAAAEGGGSGTGDAGGTSETPPEQAPTDPVV